MTLLTFTGLNAPQWTPLCIHFTEILWKLKLFEQFATFCAIGYHLYNFKNLKNTHGGVLLLVKLQAESFIFTKSNTPPWVFFTFFKLYRWYQIAQRITFGKKVIKKVIGKILQNSCEWGSPEDLCGNRNPEKKI